MAELHGNATARLIREKRTIRELVRLYCRAHHAPNSLLCDDCQSVYDYVVDRLDHCPYGDERTFCAFCPTHCYMSAMRARIKVIMRSAGREMLCRHPILTLLHVLDALRRPGKDTDR